MTMTARVGRKPTKHGQTCIALGCAVMMAACADGNGAPVGDSSAPPSQDPRHAHQAPIVHQGSSLHVGADVAPPSNRLPLVARHGDTRVFHGVLRDGVGAAAVVAYLQADAAALVGPEAEGGQLDLVPGGLVLRFAAMPPTVRTADGTPKRLLAETVRVVQAINAALPRAWQLRFSPSPAPVAAPVPADGEIVITFAREEDWPAELAAPGERHTGLAVPRYVLVATGDPELPWSIEITAGAIWIDPEQTTGRERFGVIAHELIHLLGRNHVDPDRFPGTLMVGGGREEPSGHVLHAIDREALLAVYDRFAAAVSPDRIAEELGPWSDSSLHVSGAFDVAGGEIAFGAALRNGLSQPWAVGPAPNANLADNVLPAAGARWSGRLLGLTPQGEPVAGAADLAVTLPAMTGEAHFTELEHWPADAAPDTPGSGVAWRDGHLRYEIVVRGNTFVQAGGDAGRVTGAFFGPAHEGMGGVLVRDDLSAGFGGRR